MPSNPNSDKATADLVARLQAELSEKDQKLGKLDKAVRELQDRMKRARDPRGPARTVNFRRSTNHGKRATTDHIVRRQVIGPKADKLWANIEGGLVGLDENRVRRRLADYARLLNQVRDPDVRDALQARLEKLDAIAAGKAEPDTRGAGGGGGGEIR